MRSCGYKALRRERGWCELPDRPLEGQVPWGDTELEGDAAVSTVERVIRVRESRSRRDRKVHVTNVGWDRRRISGTVQVRGGKGLNVRELSLGGA